MGPWRANLATAQAQTGELKVVGAPKRKIRNKSDRVRDIVDVVEATWNQAHLARKAIKV